MPKSSRMKGISHNLPPAPRRKSSGHTKGTTEATIQEPQDQATLGKSFDSPETQKRGPFLPTAGQTYETAKDSGAPVRVRFDSKAVAFFVKNGLQVDLEKAVLKTGNNSSFPLDARTGAQPNTAQAYAVKAGEKLPFDAEAWSFRVPGMPTGVFGKPRGVVFTGNESGLGREFLSADNNPLPGLQDPRMTDDFQGFRVDTQVLRRDRYASARNLITHRSSEIEPGSANLPEKREIAPQVRVSAPDPQAADIVEKSFERLLGRVARERTPNLDFEALEKFESRFSEMLGIAQEQQEEVDGFGILQQTAADPIAKDLLGKLHGEGAEELDGAQLLSSLRSKMFKASPLEIVVIPRNKTASQCVPNAGPQTRTQLQRAGRAYFHTTDPIAYRAQTGSKELPPQRLFVGEELLENEKSLKVVLFHELLHVFEQRYATGEESHEIAQSFREAEQFQSLYGSSPAEYLPTLGEEYLGAHGPDGPQWVRQEHPRVARLLDGLWGTGGQ